MPYVDPVAPATVTAAAAPVPGAPDPALMQRPVGSGPRVAPAAVVALVAGLAAVAGAGFLYFQKMQADSQAEALRQSIASTKEQIGGLQATAKELTTLDTQAKNLHTLFDNQRRWEAVLGGTAQRLYKNMVVSDIQMSDDGAVTLDGLTPSFQDYARIYQTLTDTEGQKYFASARPTVIAKEEPKDGQPGGVRFGFELTLQDGLLKLLPDQAYPPAAPAVAR